MIDALFGGPVAINDNFPKSRKRNLARENERRHANAPERTCEHCDAVFRRNPNSKNAGRFCSRKCAYDAGANGLRNPELDPNLAIAASAFSTKFTINMSRCTVCRERLPVGSLKKVCSSECGRKRYVAANDNVDRAPRPCQECGVVFAPEYGDKRSIYCSLACSSKNARRRRHKKERARIRGAPVEMVDPIKVFERDGWRCRICRVSTPRSLRGSCDDRAPELDHVLPLSLGGAHSYMNTQCACRRCNADKSNTPPDQPGLFAMVV